MAHVRKSRPDYGLGFQGNVLKTFQGAPSSLGSGWGPEAGSYLRLVDIVSLHPRLESNQEEEEEEEEEEDGWGFYHVLVLVGCPVGRRACPGHTPHFIHSHTHTHTHIHVHTHTYIHMHAHTLACSRVSSRA